MRQKPSEQEVKQMYLTRAEYNSHHHIKFTASQILKLVALACGWRSYLISDQEPPEEIPLEDTLQKLQASEKTLEQELKLYNFFKNNAQENPRVQTPELTEHFKAMDAYITFTQQTLQQFYTLLEKHKEIL